MSFKDKSRKMIMFNKKIKQVLGEKTAIVYERLRYYAEDRNKSDTCEVKIQDLINDIEKPRSTVFECLQILEGFGVIRRTQKQFSTEIKILKSEVDIYKLSRPEIRTAMKSEIQTAEVRNPDSSSLKSGQPSLYTEESIKEEFKNKKRLPKGSPKEDLDLTPSESNSALLFSDPTDPQQSSKSEETTSKRSRKKLKDFDLSKIDLPKWLDANLWNDFVEMREEQGKKLTVRAAKMSLNNLFAWSEISVDDAHRILRMVIQKDIQGVWHPKDDFNRKREESKPTEFKSAQEKRNERTQKAVEDYQRNYGDRFKNGRRNIKVINPFE